MSEHNKQLISKLKEKIELRHQAQTCLTMVNTHLGKEIYKLDIEIIELNKELNKTENDN